MRKVDNGKAAGRTADGATVVLRLQLDPPGTFDREKLLDLRSDPANQALTFEYNGQVAHILEPAGAGGPLPLLVVLHGAGKNKMWSPKGDPQDWAEGLQVANWAQWAKDHNMLVLYPEARNSTWDYIRSGGREDIDFIQRSMNIVRKAFLVDDGRIAAIGISDGGSMALSLGVHNPSVFQAVISASAGFCAAPPSAPRTARTPRLFIQHGSEDKLFPLARVGYGLRDKLQQCGYKVEFSVGHGEGHIPKGWQLEFLPAWLAMEASIASAPASQPAS